MADYVLGVTGGSGALYTLRVLEGILEAGHKAHVVFSEAGRRVFELELDLHLTGEPDHDATRLSDRRSLRPPAGPPSPESSPARGEGGIEESSPARGEGGIEESSPAEGRGSSEPPRSRATGRGSSETWSSGKSAGGLAVYRIDDFAAAIASGSYPTAGMAVVPCSMGTLGRVAIGSGANLIERAADVTLKERRRLVLVPREAPLSLIHIKSMLAVTEAGGEVFPASPGFYHWPQSVQDLVDGVAGRVLERLGIESRFLQRWEGPGSAYGKQAEVEV